MAGERITMDMAADGTLVAGVEGFRWPDPENIPPEAIKDGRPQAPYRNAVVAYRLEGGIPKLVTMAAVPNDESGFFIDPAISPDGARIVASLVRRATPAADLEYNGLIIMPVEEGGAGKGQGLLPGEASQPDWNGDGSRIVFLKKAVGERQIYVVNADGSGEKRISELGRDYMRPRFSPQIPG
jgi:Tol biopolymer transport system component